MTQTLLSFSQMQSNWFKKGSCAFLGALPLLSIPQLVTLPLSGHSLSFTPQNACTCQCRRLGRLSHELLWEPEKRILPYIWRRCQWEAHTPGQSDVAHLNSIVYFNTLMLWCAKHCRINWYQTCTECCTVLQCIGLQAHTVRRPDLCCNLQVCTA